jgi:hypothetical protein
VFGQKPHELRGEYRETHQRKSTGQGHMMLIAGQQGDMK